MCCAPFESSVSQFVFQSDPDMFASCIENDLFFLVSRDLSQEANCRQRAAKILRLMEELSAVIITLQHASSSVNLRMHTPCHRYVRVVLIFFTYQLAIIWMQDCPEHYSKPSGSVEFFSNLHNRDTYCKHYEARKLNDPQTLMI